VVECADAATAELVLASTGPDLRALVTDVELGGEVSGAELAQVCQASVPGSERRDGFRTWCTLCPVRHPFLMKPYEPQQMLDAVLR